MDQKLHIEKTYQDKEGVKRFDVERSSTYGQRWHNRYESNLVLNNIKKINKNKVKVLDIACGTGRIARDILKISNKDVQYDGLDSSKAMLEEFSSKIKNKKIKLHKGDATKLPFKDESFDVVYSFHLLWHLEKKDQIKIINEMLRVTKKKGIIIIDAYNKNFIYDKIIRKKPAPGKEVFKLSIKEIKEILSHLRKIEIFGILDPHINNRVIFHLLTFIPNKILKKLHFLHHMLYFKVVK